MGCSGWHPSKQPLSRPGWISLSRNEPAEIEARVTGKLLYPLLSIDLPLLTGFRSRRQPVDLDLHVAVVITIEVAVAVQTNISGGQPVGIDDLGADGLKVLGVGTAP
jgi:hypothetical protein